VVERDDNNDAFFYGSESFAACSDANEVLDVATKELRVLSGILKVFADSSEPLRAGSIRKRNAAGGEDQIIHIGTAHITSKGGHVSAVGIVTDSSGNLVVKSAPLPRTVAVEQLAASDAAVEKVMRLVAAPDSQTWAGMYRMLEVIVADVGSVHKLKNSVWSDSGQVVRFMRSANSVQASGDAARHGRENTEPPPDPMSADQAAAFLTQLIKTWLLSKKA